MKLFSLFALAGTLFLFSACGGEKKQTAHNNENSTEKEMVTDTVLPVAFYKRLEGTIANQPVVMYLQRGGNQYDGMYCYSNQGKWLLLSYLADSSQGNMIYMTERSATDIYNGTDLPGAALRFSYAGGAIKGTWTNPEKSFNFELKEAYPEGSYTFQAQFYNDSAVAFPGKPNSPVARISDWFPVADKDDATSKWINQQLCTLLGFEPVATTNDFILATKKKHEDYLKDYQSETGSLKGDDDAGAFLNYEQMQNVFVRYNENGFINFESFVFTYEGGAHGNYGSAIHCYDVLNKKEMTLKDMLTVDSNVLLPIMTRNFRLQARMQPGEELNKVLFEKQLAFTENFYFTSKGIGFIYNPYEIASYAQGIINVFVPFSDLKPYLRPEFIQRMKL